MNFDDKHRSWESTWINGPSEDPRSELDIEEYLAGLSDIELESLLLDFENSKEWQDEMAVRGIDFG